MRHGTAVVLGLTLIAVGCGSDNPTEPTPRTYTNQITTEGDIAAQAFVCVGFRQEAAGSASASSGLPPGTIEMGTGTCQGARTVVIRNETGSVTATLPVGDGFVRFQNPRDVGMRYRLVLSYLRLY
jgi:hypothetical protein